MSYLRLNRDNTILSCGCGQVSITMREWSSIAEWRQDQIRKKAAACPSCKTGTKPKRKPGFYWVRIANAKRPWWVCYWTGEHWEMPRDDRRYYDRDFAEILERPLLPPS